MRPIKIIIMVELQGSKAQIADGKNLLVTVILKKSVSLPLQTYRYSCVILHG